MTAEDVANWVIDSVNQGAPKLHTYIAAVFCLPENQAKAMAFMDACQQIEKNGIETINN